MTRRISRINLHHLQKPSFLLQQIMRLIDEVEDQVKEHAAIFNGKNYGVWSAQMQARLMKKKLRKWILSDQVIKKESEDEKSYAARVTETVRETDEEVIGLIALYVGKDYVEDIVSSKSAFEAWNKLKEIYEGNSAGELFVNRSKFTRISMKEGENVATYISRLEKLQKLCSGSDAKITEKEMIMKTLHSLTEEWDTYCEGLEARNDVMESFNLLKTLLIKKAALKNNQKDESEEEKQDKAINEKKKAFETFKKPKFTKRFNGNCYNCGKSGHKSDVCWQKEKKRDMIHAKAAFTTIIQNKIEKNDIKQYKKRYKTI